MLFIDFLVLFGQTRYTLPTDYLMIISLSLLGSSFDRRETEVALYALVVSASEDAFVTRTGAHRSLISQKPQERER